MKVSAKALALNKAGLYHTSKGEVKKVKWNM